MLDFTKVKKKFLTVKLNDETTLLIGTPRKKDLEKMLTLNDVVTSEELSFEDLDNIYEMTASLMSNNKNKKEITADYLSEIFALDEVMIFIQEYMKFLNDAMSQKN